MILGVLLATTNQGIDCGNSWTLTASSRTSGATVVQRPGSNGLSHEASCDRIDAIGK